MEGQDIRGLIEAYSQVYEAPEVLNEEVEQIDEAPMTAFQAAGGNAKLAQLNKNRSPRAGRVTAADLEKQGQDNLFKAGGGQAAIDKGPKRNAGRGGMRPTLTRQDIINKGTVAAAKPAKPQVSNIPPKEGTGKGGPSDIRRAPTPAAPTKSSGTPAAKPPTAAAKPAPAPAKPAGSAMDQWAKANPKLAAAKAERDRTRGTSATTNPLMKDMKSSLPAPKAPAPSTAKTGFDLAKKGVNLAAGVDIFDLVKGHLLDEGYAETEENALVMMSNMSEEWRESIIMELTGGKGHPGYKAGSKDHGPMETGHPADSEKRKDKGGTMSMRHGHHLGDMDDEDEDEDDLESVVKQQSRDSRERVRKPLRDKVKAARKQITRESIEQLAEISKELATKAFATRARDAFEMDDNKQHDKADKTKERIVKKHGKEAGDEAEKAAERSIYGHNKYSEAQEREREKKKSMKKEEVEINEKMEKWIQKVIDESSKTDDGTRARIKMFAGKKGIEFEPGPRWDPSANRGKGANLSPKQMEKQRRKKLRQEDLEAWVDELIAEGYDLSEYTWEEVAEIYAQELELSEAQRARENPEGHDKEEKRKYEPVRGERTPMPPRGDKRREDFEKWYRANVR